MATTKETARTYFRESGQMVRLDREVAVIFDPANPGEWGYDEAEDVLADGGYADDSAGPGDASGLTLTKKRIVRDPNACHIYRCTCTYDASTASRASRAANEEVVEEDGGSATETEYFDAAGTAVAPVKSGQGAGFPKEVPRGGFVVTRYHTIAYWWATLRAAVELCKGTLNAASFHTPEGRTLGAEGELLLADVKMTPTSSTMCEVKYIIETDSGKYYDKTSGTWKRRDHQYLQAEVDDDDVVTKTNAFNVYPKVTWADLMKTQ